MAQPHREVSGGDCVARRLYPTRVLRVQPTRAAVLAHAVAFAAIMVNIMALVPGIVGLALVGLGFADLFRFSIVLFGIGIALLPFTALMARHWLIPVQRNAAAMPGEDHTWIPPLPRGGPSPDGSGIPVKPLRPAPAMSAGQAKDLADAT